jgi:hypothetical protein
MGVRLLRWSTASALALAAVLPSGASAASSTGLYEPFPSLNGGPLVQRYVGLLGARVRPPALKHGVTVAANGATRLADEPPGAASRRAGRDVPGGGVGLLGGAVLALALVAAGVAAAMRWAGPRHDVGAGSGAPLAPQAGDT